MKSGLPPRSASVSYVSGRLTTVKVQNVTIFLEHGTCLYHDTLLYAYIKWPPHMRISKIEIRKQNNKIHLDHHPSWSHLHLPLLFIYYFSFIFLGISWEKMFTGFCRAYFAAQFPFFKTIYTICNTILTFLCFMAVSHGPLDPEKQRTWKIGRIDKPIFYPRVTVFSRRKTVRFIGSYPESIRWAVHSPAT